MQSVSLRHHCMPRSRQRLCSRASKQAKWSWRDKEVGQHNHRPSMFQSFSSTKHQVLALQKGWCPHQSGRSAGMSPPRKSSSSDAAGRPATQTRSKGCSRMRICTTGHIMVCDSWLRCNMTDHCCAGPRWMHRNAAKGSWAGAIPLELQAHSKQLIWRSVARQGVLAGTQK